MQILEGESFVELYAYMHKIEKKKQSDLSCNLHHRCLPKTSAVDRFFKPSYHLWQCELASPLTRKTIVRHQKHVHMVSPIRFRYFAEELFASNTSSAFYLQITCRLFIYRRIIIEASFWLRRHDEMSWSHVERKRHMPSLTQKSSRSDAESSGCI